MKKLFYYKIEPSRGYLAGDKVRVHDEPYETGYFRQIIGEEILKEYNRVKDYKSARIAFHVVKDAINENIQKFLETRPQSRPEVKPFYLNFNADGIDCFVHRWNWKNCE